MGFLLALVGMVVALGIGHFIGYRGRIEDEKAVRAFDVNEDEIGTCWWQVDVAGYVAAQIEWSRRVFGSPKYEDPERLSRHIQKELKEIEKHPTDCEEWIDVIILALEGAWRTGHSPTEIARILQEKQYKNFARKWVIPADPSVPIEHDRSDDCPVEAHVHDMKDGSLEFHGRSNLAEIYGREERESNP